MQVVPGEGADLPAFQPLYARIAGQPIDTTLHQEVSPSLAAFLQQWIKEACRYDPPIAARAALRLGLTPLLTAGDHVSYVAALTQVESHQLLAVVDALLYFHTDIEIRDPWGELTAASIPYSTLAERLDNALEDSGSVFQVADNVRQLVEHVDATVTAVFEQTTAIVEPITSELLRDAWRQAYGFQPNPTTAYYQAVRAVEQVACPLVLPNNPKATLGAVISHLRNAGDKWSFILVGKEGVGTVEPIVAMLERLWTGQASRHGGGPNSRDQTQQEAETAVHLAAVLAQWLTTGALQKNVP